METDFKKFLCYHLYRKFKKNHFLVLVQRLDPQTSDGTKIVQYKRRTGTKVGLWYKSRTGTIKRLYWSDLCTGLTIVLVWPLYWSDLCTGLTFILVWRLYCSDVCMLGLYRQTFVGLTFVLVPTSCFGDNFGTISKCRKVFS